MVLNHTQEFVEKNYYYKATVEIAMKGNKKYIQQM